MITVCFNSLAVVALPQIIHLIHLVNLNWKQIKIKKGDIFRTTQFVVHHFILHRI